MINEKNLETTLSGTLKAYEDYDVKIAPDYVRILENRQRKADLLKNTGRKINSFSGWNCIITGL